MSPAPSLLLSAPVSHWLATDEHISKSAFKVGGSSRGHRGTRTVSVYRCISYQACWVKRSQAVCTIVAWAPVVAVVILDSVIVDVLQARGMGRWRLHTAHLVPQWLELAGCFHYWCACDCMSLCWNAWAFGGVQHVREVHSASKNTGEAACKGAHKTYTNHRFETRAKTRHNW